MPGLEARGGGTRRGVLVHRREMGRTRAGGALERIELLVADGSLGAFIAKSYVDGTGERLHGVFARRALPGLPIAYPIAYMRERRLLLMREAPGLRLDQSLAAGAAEQAMARTGGALAALHRAAPAGDLPRLTIERLVDDLRPAPGALPGALAAIGQQVEAWLRDSGRGCDARQVLCHRDLHLRQVFMLGDQVTLVDLDHAGLGHPGLDVANLSVYLRHKLPWRAPALVTAFRTGYLAAGGDIDPVAVRIFSAFTWLRLALKNHRWRGPAFYDRTAWLLARARDATHDEVEA